LPECGSENAFSTDQPQFFAKSFQEELKLFSRGNASLIQAR